MARSRVVSFERDRKAAAALAEHHVGMLATLDGHVEALVAAVALAHAGDVDTVRLELTAWCRAELLPHAAAEERLLYPVGYADPRGTLLVEGMLAEHQMIQRLVTEVDDTVDAVYAAATAHALRHVFEAHMVKENDLLLPMLARSPHVSLADIAAEPRSLAGATG